MLPWFIAIIGSTDNAFLAASVGHDLVPKLYGNQEGHRATGTYSVLLWLTFFHGATLVGVAAPAIVAARREPDAKFLLAWLVPSWPMLELLVTKLPHYVLPLYLGIAILIAGILDTPMLSRNRWLAKGTSWWFTLPALLGIAGIVVRLSIAHQLSWALAAGASVAGLAQGRLHEVDERSLRRGRAGTLLIWITRLGIVIPSLEPLFPRSALARILSESGCANPVAAAAGYQERSLVLLAPTPTRSRAAALRIPGRRGLPSRLHRGTPGARVCRAGGHDRLRYECVARVNALNLSNLQVITIAVFRSESSL